MFSHVSLCVSVCLKSGQLKSYQWVFHKTYSECQFGYHKNILLSSTLMALDRAHASIKVTDG